MLLQVYPNSFVLKQAVLMVIVLNVSGL